MFFLNEIVTFDTEKNPVNGCYLAIKAWKWGMETNKQQKCDTQPKEIGCSNINSRQN